MASNESAVAKQVQYRQWAQDVRDRNSRPQNISVRTWCDQHGLKISTYYWRLRALRAAYLNACIPEASVDEICDQASVSFVELKPPMACEPKSTPKVTIRAGSVSIEVSESISDEFLLRIMEAAS